MDRVDWWRVIWPFGGGIGFVRSRNAPECPYDELVISMRFPGTRLSLPARLMLAKGYARAQWLGYGDLHGEAHEWALMLACGEL